MTDPHEQFWKDAEERNPRVTFLIEIGVAVQKDAGIWIKGYRRSHKCLPTAGMVNTALLELINGVRPQIAAAFARRFPKTPYVPYTDEELHFICAGVFLALETTFGAFPRDDMH